MDAWLIPTARTLVILAFAVGFPLLAVLHGRPVAPPEEPDDAVRPPAEIAAAERDGPPPQGRITGVTPVRTNTPERPAPPSDPGSLALRDPVAAPASDAPPDRFTAIQSRLQQLGASYLLLESLGEPRTAFRFHCELDAPGHDRAGRLFEVTDANPLVAMEKVLRQVEESHAARTPLGDRLR